MNSRIISILFAFLVITTYACEDANSSKKTTIEPNASSSQTFTAFNLDERLKEVDSLVLVYYKDPYGKDSLRYTRYYTQISLIGDFSTLNSQLSSFYLQQDFRKCRTEGKIWCFSKGKVFQTLYFATNCDTCCFTYLIKDGNFYYSALRPGFTDWLTANKSRSKELPNNAEKSE
jgi:hypothetical protein